MSQKSYFRTHFDTLNVKGCQTVLILCTTAVLSYFFITPKKIRLETVPLSDIWNLRTVC